MADLDAELLALAGGDSSGDESVASPRRKSSSPARPAQQTLSSEISRKATVKSTKKSRRRRSYSDDEDEPASPSERSDSISMSRSESEAGFDPTEDKPMFPYEKYYHDANDKAEIDTKPEIERESILAQRSEQLERYEQDLQLRRLLAAREKEAARQEARKRKASAADLDENQRKSSRQRRNLGGGRVGEASSAIAAYKKQREEKSLREEQRKIRPAAGISDIPSNDYSDGDAEADSDHEYNDRRYKRRSPSPPKDDPDVELADLQRIRVGRDNFAQVCWTPGFQDAISGCYARVCLGPGRTPGVNEYRMCSIAGFSEGRPYAMTGPNGKTFVIDQYVIAAHGKARRPWSFLECSNSRFTEEEWRRWRATMANDEIKLPTKSQIGSKLHDINSLIAYKFKDAEISQKLKRQNALVDKVNRTVEKQGLKDQIHEASLKDDTDLVQELEDRLANVVPMKLAFSTSLNPQSQNSKALQEAERREELNRRNQRLTAESVRKAEQAARRVYKKKALLDTGRLAPLGPDDDLFGSASDVSRAGTPVPATQPKTSSSLAQNGESAAAATPVTTATAIVIDHPSSQSQSQGTTGGEAAALASGTSTPARDGTPLALKASGQTKKGLPVIRKAKRDDEVLASLDLGLDIEL